MYHDENARKKKKNLAIIILILFGIAIFLFSLDETPPNPPEPIKVVTKQPKAVEPPEPEPIKPKVEAKPEPKYKTKWESNDEKGNPYSELFTHTSEDMQGLEAKMVSGIYKLSDKKGQIYQVSFRQAGESCKQKTNPDGGYFGNIEIIKKGHAFKWGGKWEGKPCSETYEAFYEIPVRECIENCK